MKRASSLNVQEKSDDWVRIFKILPKLLFSPKYFRYFTLCIEMLLVNGADRQNCLAVYIWKAVHTW